MKKTVILAAVACLLFAATSVFAQSKTDFSGNWTLDVNKTKNFESGSMTVTQTDKDITYKTDLKRAPRPDGAGGGMGQGNGGGGRGMGGMMGGAQPMTYTLDGKETSSQFGSGDRTGTAKMQANWDGNKLKFTTKRSFNTPNGEMTRTTKETWELADGGKTLKVTRESETMQGGTQTTEFYYTKQ